MKKNLLMMLIFVACAPFARAGFLGDNGFIGEAGYGFSFYQYVEPDLMQIEGSVQSVYAKLGYVWGGHGFMVNYNTTLGKSNTTYYGSTIASTSGGVSYPINDVAQSDKFYSVELMYVASMSHYLGEMHKGIAYIGLGYRSLRNENVGNTYVYNNTIRNLSDHIRDQEYYYLPLGVYGKENLISDLWFRYGVEARWMFLGKNRTQRLSNNIVTQDHKYEQKNGFGFKLAAGLDYEIAQAFDIFAQAVFDYWWIPQSSKVWESATTYWIEPKNYTLQAGVEVGIRF